ncbi:MAG: radical SAM protein [Deltaproteobacteria bacterium]|nr:radical SAM protein [Deltaproteobacteria bacterium]
MIARRVRARRPELPIVVGGHHATTRPEDYLGEVDWVVRHDGERPLRRLCEAWPARPDATEVLDGGAFDQGEVDPIDWDRYGPETWERALWVGTSRGCAFKCRFCVEPERGARYSRHTVEHQIDILERLVHRASPRVIAFSDPLFGGNRAWLEAFLDRLSRRALPVMFWCETRADLMTPALLEAFLANEFMVDFGLDAANETMVRRMGKAARPEVYLERARATFDHANRIGLHHGIYLIFNFPGETPETTRASQAWIESLGAGAGPMAGWLSCQTFFVLPGTDSYARMAEHAETLGTRVAHPTWWLEHGDHYRLATDVLPSAAWRGREEELVAFRDWNARVNAAWSARYPPEVQAFRARFYLG